MESKVQFEEINCPNCDSNDCEIVADDLENEMEFNMNFYCYSRWVFCQCNKCNKTFRVKELIDIVGYDPDSIKLCKE